MRARVTHAQSVSRVCAPNMLAQVSVAVLIDKFVSASAVIKMEKKEQEAAERKNKEVRVPRATPAPIFLNFLGRDVAGSVREALALPRCLAKREIIKNKKHVLRASFNANLARMTSQ